MSLVKKAAFEVEGDVEKPACQNSCVRRTVKYSYLLTPLPQLWLRHYLLVIYLLIRSVVTFVTDYPVKRHYQATLIWPTMVV